MLGFTVIFESNTSKATKASLAKFCLPIWSKLSVTTNKFSLFVVSVFLCFSILVFKAQENL